ncbi:hypothetical protein FIBSPDRAFT_899768 [Athelia psychrophila]|uniref:Uncharacterized protein n=1 Tax=Athelia psychrophila TaxID=1759441 RepID=A0A165ZC81_9AGAM|nr:hypothetical protein FIBSPDRAFT_899768 [Fibularhizoctonia sp. CBS 109695]
MANIAKWKNIERQRIKPIILPCSGGMFRWVELQLYDVSKCSSKKDLYEQLDSLPQGLDETYARIFKRSKKPDVLLKLLQWLAFSQLVAAVDLSRADGPVYDPDMRYEDPAEVLNLCYGLVTGFEARATQDQRAAFTLCNHSNVPGTSAAFGQAEHFSLVEEHPEFQKSHPLRSLFPLSDYAAAYWVSHFHSASADATGSPRRRKGDTSR